MAQTIIRAARDIIQKLKENKPVRDELYIYDNKTSDVIEAAFQECKSKVLDKDGTVRLHGSTIPYEHVKRIGRIYINNITQIPEDIVSQAYARDGVPGPWLKMTYSKQVDENGKISANVHQLGTDIRNQELDNDQLLNKYLYEPLAKLYLEQVQNVNRRVKFINKFQRKNSIDNIEAELRKALLEDCKKRGLDTSRVVAISGWLARSMGANATFRDKVINMRDTLDESSEKSYTKVLDTLKASIESEVINHVYSLDGQREAQIMNDINAQLNAYSKDISEMDEQKILMTINEINTDTLRTSYDLASHKQHSSGYRDCEVVIGNKDTGTRCVKAKDVPKAMSNLSKDIKALVDREPELTDIEYIKEVARLNYRFIRIHPFPDGNGRTSRAIVNMLMSRKNSIIVFDKKEKEQYTYIMKRASEQIGKSEHSEYLSLLSENPGALENIEAEHLDELSSYIAEKHFRHVSGCPDDVVQQRLVENTEQVK